LINLTSPGNNTSTIPLLSLHTITQPGLLIVQAGMGKDVLPGSSYGPAQLVNFLKTAGTATIGAVTVISNQTYQPAANGGLSRQILYGIPVTPGTLSLTAQAATATGGTALWVNNGGFGHINNPNVLAIGAVTTSVTLVEFGDTVAQVVQDDGLVSFLPSAPQTVPTGNVPTSYAMIFATARHTFTDTDGLNVAPASTAAPGEIINYTGRNTVALGTGVQTSCNNHVTVAVLDPAQSTADLQLRTNNSTFAPNEMGAYAALRFGTPLPSGGGGGPAPTVEINAPCTYQVCGDDSACNGTPVTNNFFESKNYGGDYTAVLDAGTAIEITAVIEATPPANFTNALTGNSATRRIVVDNTGGAAGKTFAGSLVTAEMLGSLTPGQCVTITSKVTAKLIAGTVGNSTLALTSSGSSTKTYHFNS
jgi:hypothetical protein